MEENKKKNASRMKYLRNNYVRFPLDLRPSILEEFKEACAKNNTKPTTEIKKFIREYCEENK